MAALPYVVFSLTGKLGRLNLQEAGRLGLVGALILLGFWAVGVLVIVAVTQILPAAQAASFFSAPEVATSEEQQPFVSMFIPTNVFRSLSDGVVPAVVVFCLLFGMALSAMPGKGGLLDLLDLCAETMARISLWLVKLAPLGLFALTAAAAGTLQMDELVRLQAYLVMFLIACLFVAFALLPLVIHALTDIRYRDFLRAAWDPVLTAFATGKLLVVLPLIVEKCDQLLGASGDEATSPDSSTASVMVPLAYPFPHLGKTLGFVFISFAAWYVGRDLSFVETADVGGVGAVSSFASPLVSMPFLLDRYRLPQDLMSLFLLPGFFTMRMADVVGVVHLMTLTILSTRAAGTADISPAGTGHGLPGIGTGAGWHDRDRPDVSRVGPHGSPERSPHSRPRDPASLSRRDGVRGATRDDPGEWSRDVRPRPHSPPRRVARRVSPRPSPLFVPERPGAARRSGCRADASPRHPLADEAGVHPLDVRKRHRTARLG